MTEVEKKAKPKGKKKSGSKKADRSVNITAIAEPSAQVEKVASYIVGIGASAGGLAAFERFFENMPPDSGMGFVLVPHLDPTHVSILPELLQKRTTMKVAHVRDGSRVKADSVNIVPPNHDLSIMNGVLHLMEPEPGRSPKLPIDYFFRALAEDQREKTICIILSGMGTDGTLGFRAVKEALGMTMAQELGTTKFEGMPRSAIETDLVDYILPPEKMPEQLIRYVEHTGQKVTEAIKGTSGKTTNDLQKIFFLLRSHTGHDFSLYKPNTICRRIERRMNVQQIDTISNYVRYLQRNSQEVHTLFKEILIGVTNFFRDPEAFRAMKNEILPALLETKADDACLRMWVPGCSSGEEAYSMAIVLAEVMELSGRKLKVQIFATDIDSDVIESARAGIYADSISHDVSPTRLSRYFVREDNLYRIRNDIREMLVFAPQNVIKDPPFTKLDLICCRNLLIYLDGELQAKLIPLFHYSLNPGGILFLGSSETIGRFVDLFSVVERKWKIYGAKERLHSNRPMVEFPLNPSMKKERRLEEVKAPEATISQIAEKSLLECFAPPAVIINQKGDILYIHGRTGRYMEPAPGEASWSIFEMVREGLKLELPSAIRKARDQQKKITYEHLPISDAGKVQFVNLAVKPLGDTASAQGLMIVTFEDVPSPRQAESAKLKGASKKKPDRRIEELKDELKYTKEHLQTMIEELETSNEELKATNEELQSTNEELQSSNEELETSKEELQSLNEELVTVNSELQGKIDELTGVHNDMKNLLDSMEIPTIFLDSNLQIRRFTNHATKVINLIATDVGRPIHHIASKFMYEHLVEDAKEVLRTLAVKEVVLQVKEGRWYAMRILPYRTIDNVIDGVVITFVDIHKQKLRETELQGNEPKS